MSGYTILAIAATVIAILLFFYDCSKNYQEQRIKLSRLVSFIMI